MVLPIQYKSLRIRDAYRVDILIENQLIIEIKAIEAVHPVHKAQLLTYLKAASIPLGLLINFNVSVLKQGIHRIAN